MAETNIYKKITKKQIKEKFTILPPVSEENKIKIVATLQNFVTYLKNKHS
jgi:hypothetical protein